MTIAYASNMSVGDPLGPPTPGSPVSSQSVVAIEKQGARVKITTSLGLVYEFNWNERVMLPRRPDGATTDWRDQEMAPLPTEIYCGDILPDPNSPKPDIPQLIPIWRQTYQRVTGVYRVAAGAPVICIIAYQEATGGVRRWYLPENERLTFPRMENRAFGVNEERPLKSSTYKDRMTDGITYEFLIHPAGAGRWPKDAPEFIWKSDPGHYVMRPPSNRSGWRRLQFIGENDTLRHPRDPKWHR